MKQSKKCWAIYLALFLLLFLLLLPFKEGLEDGHGWLDFSGWFTTSETPTNSVSVSRSHSTLNNTSNERPTYNNNEGTGNTGKKYTQSTEDKENELTSNEKTYARSALDKLLYWHDDDNLTACIKKIKGHI